MIKKYSFGVLACGLLCAATHGAMGQTTTASGRSVKGLTSDQGVSVPTATIQSDAASKPFVMPTPPRTLADDEVFVVTRSSDPSVETKSFITKLLKAPVVPANPPLTQPQPASNEPMKSSARGLEVKPTPAK